MTKDGAFWQRRGEREETAIKEGQRGNVSGKVLGERKKAGVLCVEGSDFLDWKCQ